MIAVRTLLLAGVALGLAKFSSAFLDQDEGCAAALPNEGGWLTGTEEMPAYWEVYETEDFADMSFYELSPMALEVGLGSPYSHVILMCSAVKSSSR